MEISTQLSAVLILIGIFIALVVILTALVLWARKHSKGANLVAATSSFIAPDPLFDKN